MSEQTPVREITREELVQKRQQGEAFILVDVLSHEHFSHVHLPGAINVPLQLMRDLAPLLFSKQDPIIVYCANPECTASPTAAKILLQLGYTDVLDYAGGIQDWLDHDLPVIHKPEATRGEAA